MFKMGGKAASQGTGITSGLDKKVNYSIGGGVIQGQNMGGREGFQAPEYSYNSLLRSAIDKIERRNKAHASAIAIWLWSRTFSTSCTS